MKLTIPDRVNRNCYVFQMGFQYPVCIWHRRHYLDAQNQLRETHLGNFANEHHYWAPGRLKSMWQDRADWRWYAGQRLWRHRQHPETDFWLVFRTESDRTLAMMLIHG